MKNATKSSKMLETCTIAKKISEQSKFFPTATKPQISAAAAASRPLPRPRGRCRAVAVAADAAVAAVAAAAAAEHSVKYSDRPLHI